MVGVVFFDIVDIVVNIELIVFSFYGAHGQIGAVVSHPFQIGYQILQDKTELDSAFSFLQPSDMSALDLGMYGVYHFFERLYSGGRFYIGLFERFYRHADYIFHCCHENIQLCLSVI